MADRRMIWLRRTFRVLERAAPGPGARLAWRVWTTPTRPDPRAVDRSRAAGVGEVRTVAAELPDWTGRRPAGPEGRPRPPRLTRIAVELWGPADGPVVYLLHGWGGWRGQFAPIGRALAERGCRAVLIDTPNHGDSGPGALGPGHSLLPDFTLTLQAVAREFGPAHAVVGHSLGGGCAASALLDGLPAHRAVFIAPAVDPVAFTRTLAGMLGFGERIRTRMVAAAHRRTGLDLAAFIVPPRAAGRDDLPEALIVHDTGDPIVHVGNGRALAGAWPGARLVRTDGLGHSRILRDEAVIAEVVGFITGEAKSRSGAAPTPGAAADAP